MQTPPAPLPLSLTRPQSTSALPPPAHRLLAAFRAAVIVHRSGQCPRERLSALLGSDRAAAAWILLLNSASAAWPEPMAVYPPCCAVMTHDESAVIDLVALAATGNRPRFDRLLHDLLSEDARDHVFTAATRFVSTYLRA